MSDPEDDPIAIVIDEDPEEKVAGPSEEPFEANVYISKLIEFINSKEQDANQKFSEFVAQTWARSADSANFCTDSYSLDSGGVSKLPANMMMMPQKRIAGTQRLMYPPPQIMNKTPFGIEKPGASSSSSGAGPSSSAGVSGIKKVKKQIPVIDDSIYCTTDQPCLTCGGVSLSGNQVLVCKRCRDCYHMRCGQPPVSVEEASDPKFNYYCKTCLISKKVMDSSRSRSPSPAMLDARKMKIGREKLAKP